MRAAGVMRWTVRLETRTSAEEVKTTELVTFSRPAVIGTALVGFRGGGVSRPLVWCLVREQRTGLREEVPPSWLHLIWSTFRA